MTDSTEVTRTLWAAVGANAKRLREAAELAQVDVAEAMVGCGVPWTGVTVAKVETGRRDVTVGELVALGYCLDATPTDLLDCEGLVQLSKGGSRQVAAEAVTRWALGERIVPWRVIEVIERERGSDAVSPWMQSPGMRRARATARRLRADYADQPGALSPETEAELEDVRRRVQGRLGAWIASEYDARRPVTPHRLRGKESSLWTEEIEGLS